MIRHILRYKQTLLNVKTVSMAFRKQQRIKYIYNEFAFECTFQNVCFSVDLLHTFTCLPSNINSIEKQTKSENGFRRI